MCGPLQSATILREVNSSPHLVVLQWSFSKELCVRSSALFVLNVHQTGVGLCSLGVYELAFLLFRVKEAAQVEDDGQKEHEAGHSNDRHSLLAKGRAIEGFTPTPTGHVHRIFNVNTQSVIFLHATVQVV